MHSQPLRAVDTRSMKLTPRPPPYQARSCRGASRVPLRRGGQVAPQDLWVPTAPKDLEIYRPQGFLACKDVNLGFGGIGGRRQRLGRHRGDLVIAVEELGAAPAVGLRASVRLGGKTSVGGVPVSTAAVPLMALTGATYAVGPPGSGLPNK